jgi:hypothetical protein
LKPEAVFENERYQSISRQTLRDLKDAVTIPPDWLLISGRHKIEAQREATNLKPESASGAASEDASEEPADSSAAGLLPAPDPDPSEKES